MATTPRLGLTKPLQTDFYNIDVHNGNSDIIDLAVKNLQDNKEDKVTGGFFTNVGEIIPSGSNIFSITKLGNHRGNQPATYTNSPFTTAFQLIVSSGISAEGTAYANYTAIDYVTGRIATATNTSGNSGGGFSAWNYNQTSLGELIPDGANINNYTKTGRFRHDGGVLTNSGFGNEAFVMDVISSIGHDNATFVTQIQYRSYGGNRIVVRQRVSGTWSTWDELATLTQLALKANQTDLNTTNSNVSALTTRTTNLENSRASTTVYGLVKVGSNLGVSNGEINGDALASSINAVNTNLTNLANTKASTTVYGLMQVGTNLNVTNGIVRVADTFVNLVNSKANQTSLDTTNTNVTNLTGRVNNLETSRALQTSLDTTNGRVTVLETYSSSAVTPAIGGFSQFTAIKTGKSVSILVNSGSAFTGNVNAGTYIGTVPVGYRPTTTVYASLNTDIGSPSNLLISINTSGLVTLLSNNTASANVYVGCISYPIT